MKTKSDTEKLALLTRALAAQIAATKAEGQSEAKNRAADRLAFALAEALLGRALTELERTALVRATS